MALTSSPPTATTSSWSLPEKQQRRRRRCGQVFGRALALKPCMKKKEQRAFITNLPPFPAKKLPMESDDESDSFTALTAALSIDEEDDCFSTGTSSAPATPTKKSVRFDTVEVRHYGRTVDDHPCTQSGPALTLTWKVELREKLAMSTFECIRAQQRSRGCPSRLDAAARQRILMHDWNVPAYEIRNAMYASQFIRKQRQDTSRALRDAWYFGEDDYCYNNEEEEWCNDSDCADDELLWDLAQEHYAASSQRYAVDAEEEDEPHLLAYDY